jgi:hypothetical protein
MVTIMFVHSRPIEIQDLQGGPSIYAFRYECNRKKLAQRNNRLDKRSLVIRHYSSFPEDDCGKPTWKIPR